MRPHAHANLPAAAPARRRHGARKTAGMVLFRRPAIRAILSRPRLLLGAAGAIVGMVLFSAGAAFAYFLFTDSSNNALAAANTLPAPGAVAGNGTATSASIPVTWTAPGGTPSYTPTGYVVLRCQGSGCTNFAAITSGSCASVTATNCADNDPALTPSTTYRYEVEAKLDNWVSGPGTAFTASTTGPAKLAFTAQPPSSVQAKGTGTFSVSVAIQDSNGTTVSNDTTDKVSLTLTGGTPGAALSCSSPTMTSGVATFTGCTVDKVGSNYQLTATSGSLTSATSNSFNVTAGNPAQLAFTTQPVTSQSGVGFPVAVTIQDSNGNPVINDNSDQVALSLTGGTSGAILTCSGGSSAQASSGVASFKSCAVNKAGTGYTLTATSGSLSQATSNSFNITGSKLAFTGTGQPPASTQATPTGPFNVTVAVQDTTGATDTNDNSGQVTLGLTGGVSGANLTCKSLTASVSSGVANFTGCDVDKAGSGYQLTATSTGLTSATSTTFAVTAGTPTQITATSGGSQSAAVSTAFKSPLTATVTDADGNPVSGVSVTFTAPSSNASATFATSGCNPSSSLTSCATTNSSGVATSSSFTANSTAGPYSITASTSGVSGTAGFAETNTSAPSVSINSLTTANGGGTKGEIDQGDMVTIGFSNAIEASTVCSTWTNTGDQTITGTVTVDGNGTNKDDELTFADASGSCNLGTIDLGTNAYYTPSGSSTLKLTGSTLAYSSTNHTLTITLGARQANNGKDNQFTSGSALTLSLATSVLDSNGAALTGYTFTSASAEQF